MAYVRPKTVDRGADDERNAILRHMRRVRGRIQLARPALDEIIAWINLRATRAADCPGGLKGRRKKQDCGE